ncbi:hypothetical protein [Nibricoccus sp. IMCC34717]|uniref:hypothetical protein n=1 Tax=Nibricoccus sp. IMCC34717 TaxID=3034021 RepID=UPI00384D8767
MFAYLLVVSLFLFLVALGQAVISLFRPRLGILWSWFVAPAVGVSLLIVLLTRLNVNHIPVATAGPWLTLGLAVFTAGVFVWRRPTLPWKQLLPFLIVVCGYLLYTGWPMLRFGFNWISYGNDDMANYCLAADRFLNHGYYDLPLQTELEGADYAQHYWFMHSLQQIRPGSELILSWVASLTRLHPHEIFMPSILMLSMMQIFSLGAVGLVRGRNRRIVLLAFVVFAMSPLFGLGTLYQLIAQVGGIGILLAISSLVLVSRRLTWRKLAVTGLLTACLGILYPEVAPFVALSISLVALRYRWSRREGFGDYALWILGVAALTFALIASNTYQFINTLVMQSTGSAGLGAMAEINDQSGGLVLFPWTLVPSFIPMLVGLHPFGVVGVDPLISIQIAVAALIVGFLLYRAFKNLVAEEPVGYLATVMFPLGLYLFFKGQDFGLFKLAMFAQPVITLMLAQGFHALVTGPRQKLGRAVLVIYLLCTIPSHVYYSYASLGTYGGGLTEVVGASRLGVEFTPPKDLSYGGIQSDISNVVSAKLLAQYTQGIDTRFLSRSYMDNIANIAVLKFLREPNPDLGPQARLVEKLARLRFMLPDELMKGDVPDYRVMSIQKLDNNWTETSSRHLNYNDRLFVAVRTELDHFNKLNPGDGWTIDNMYQYKLESQVRDRLVFTHSELSPHYYSSARFKASFFQREPEPITRGEVYFHGTGRHTTFQILHPSPNLRMVIDFSRTSLGEGRSKLPDKATVIGEDDYKVPFVGSGSARVFTGIIKPEYYEKQAYVTVDFGEQPATIIKEKTGLMRLYGQKFYLDDRRLVGFTRDISVMTDEQYRALKRPLRIGDFPGDLSRYPGLEYSGLFEDGWVADDSFFKLGASKAGQILTLDVEIPDSPENRGTGVELTLSINEKPTETVLLRSGRFTLTRMVKEPADITSVSLHFNKSSLYGRKDPRYVSAFIHSLSIDEVADFAAFRRLSNAAGERLDVKGIDDDGWAEREIALTAPLFDTFKVLKLDIEMPGWASIAANTLTVEVDGKAVVTEEVPRANFHTVYIPLAAGARHEVKVSSSAVFTLPNEKRERAFLIRNVSFENLSRSDLFARGWHLSGYRFGIQGVDTDGWAAGRVALTLPPSEQYKRALIQLVRYPARADYPLTITVDGTARQVPLQLEQSETIEIPLNSAKETAATLEALESFPLSDADPRVRSFRIINIDFD